MSKIKNGYISRWDDNTMIVYSDGVVKFINREEYEAKELSKYRSKVIDKILKELE